MAPRQCDGLCGLSPWQHMAATRPRRHTRVAPEWLGSAQPPRCEVPPMRVGASALCGHGAAPPGRTAEQEGQSRAIMREDRVDSYLRGIIQPLWD